MVRSHRGMLPLAAVKPVIGRTFAIGPDAQERAEGVERVEAAVKPECELVEVGLQVLRLAAPVVPAMLGNVASLRDAVARLREAHATSLALAPCVIGPECTQGELAVAAAETGGRCAQPLGAHPAIGRLVAIRYGAALQDPRIARAAGRA